MKLTKKVTIFIIIILASSFVLFDSSVKANSPAWYNSSWLYRSSFVVGSASGAGTNFQVPLIVINGTGVSSGNTTYINNQTQSYFLDLRVTANDGVTLYPIWNQTTNVGANVTLWINIGANLTASSATCYLYWGNPSATSVWNETAVMVDVIPSLIASYPMTAGSGTTVNDVSGNNHNLIMNYSGMTWQTGIYANQYAINFSGVGAGNGWLETNSLIGVNESFTAICWANSPTVGYAGLMSEDKGGDLATARDWFVGGGQGTNNVRAREYTYAGTSIQYDSANGVFPNNSWMQIGIEYDYNTSSMYIIINGTRTLESTSVVGLSNRASNFTVGTTYSSGYIFAGKIVYPIIVQGALSQTQVTNLYTNYPDSTLHTGTIDVRKYLASPSSVGTWGATEQEQVTVTYHVTNGLLWVNSTSTPNGTVFTYNKGTALLLTASPYNSTYSFQNFTCFFSTSTNNPYTIILNTTQLSDENQTITANFAQPTGLTADDAVGLALVFGVLAIGVSLALITVYKKHDGG